MDAETKILFLCTGNSCRSQMAEGWARALGAGSIEPYSAGIEAHGIDPLAVEAMAESGVDISNHRSKTINDLTGIEFDTVVTVCEHAAQNCPLFPGPAKLIRAFFDDPPRLARDAKSRDEALAHYRRVRDEIRRYMEQLLTEIDQRQDR